MLSQSQEEMRQELLRLYKYFECPICLNLMSNPMVTRCVHRFCAQCINRAIETSSSDYCRCPLCKEKITKRGLRKQDDINDIAEALKEAVNSFEKDCQMKVITNAEDVVVFDVSADKSKSCLQIDASLTEVIDVPSMTEEFKEIDETNESITEVKADNKTTTINYAMDSQIISDSIEEDVSKDNNATDIYFDTSKNSFNEKINDSELMSVTSDSIASEKEINPTQSQNLKVNKSKITYGSSRRSREDDKFDRIIFNTESDRRSDKSSEQTSSKGMDQVCESDIPVRTNGKIIIRKPLNHLNKNNDQKKKIQTIETSDDESSPVIAVKPKRKIATIKDSSQESLEKGSDKKVKETVISQDDKSEDLFLPPINGKIDSNEVIRSNDSVRSESSNGYQSDTQLIPSSPFSSDLF